LFDVFFDRLSFLLSDYLSLLSSCVSQDSEELARIGIRAQQQMLMKTGAKFTVTQWWKTLEIVNEGVQSVIPQILISQKIRQILGLVNANESKDKESSNNSGATSESAQPTGEAENTAVTNTSATPAASGSSPSPAAPSSSPPAVLPFSPVLVYQKTRVQLLLLESLADLILQYFPVSSDLSFSSSSSPLSLAERRTDSRVLGHLSVHQLFFSLEIFTSSLTFSRAFNSDIELRRKLYGAGFVVEQTSRLPQLFLLEAKALKLQLHILWKLTALFEGEMNETQANERMETSSTASVNSEAATQTVDYTDPSLTPRALILEAEQRFFSCFTALIQDYCTKIKAGQLVSLEFLDEVLVVALSQFSSHPDPVFLHRLPQLYPSLCDLIEFGSIPVRGAMRKLMQGKIGDLLTEGIKANK
jgi:hypothetical protein